MNNAKITIIGVGSAGALIVQSLQRSMSAEIDFIGADADAQLLSSVEIPRTIQIGEQPSPGLGTPPRYWFEEAVSEKADLICHAVSDRDLVFIVAGMGGGTGTFAGPAIARLCHESGVPTVAVVGSPFQYEGKHRIKRAEAGVAAMTASANLVVGIEYERRLAHMPSEVTLLDAFEAIDEHFEKAITGLTDLFRSGAQDELIDGYAIDLVSLVSYGPAITSWGTGNTAVEAMERAVEPLAGTDRLMYEYYRWILVFSSEDNLSRQNIEDAFVRFEFAGVRPPILSARHVFRVGETQVTLFGLPPKPLWVRSVGADH